MQKISISAGFKEGETIPAEYTCSGENVSPALAWSGIPQDTKSIALIMDDPDAPGGSFVHWVLYNIPAGTQKLPRGLPKHEILSDGSLQGNTNYGRPGYSGPCPPKGKPHRYYFRLYALDRKLDLNAGATKADVEIAMKGHILAQGVLMGKFGR